MSIIWTLRKYVDAIEHREEEAAGQRDRRVARRQGLPEDGEDPGLAPPEAPARRYECRVCKHASSNKTYCPRCLADTMVELPAAP